MSDEFTLRIYSQYYVGALIRDSMKVTSMVSEGCFCRTEKPSKILSSMCASVIRSEDRGACQNQGANSPQDTCQILKYYWAEATEKTFKKLSQELHPHNL